MTTTSPETFEIAGELGPVRGDIFRDTDAKGTVIICHGFKGFARWGFFPHLSRKLAAAGLNAVSFDFSGSGIGADRESTSEAKRFSDNTFTAEQKDLDGVIAYAREEKLIEGKFGLFGHSRGGGAAILRAGSDPEVGALVTWASISHVRRWGSEESERWRREGFAEITNSRTGQVLKLGTALLDDVETNAEGSLDIEAAASRISAPWLILHGASDETVDQGEARRLHAASAHSKLRIIPGNHGFDAKHPLLEIPPTLEQATAETVQFFSANLVA
jgi:dienelactone hydrolase